MDDIEYLIALDGSPDPVVRIAQEAAREDSRVRLLYLPHRGIYSTLNAAFRMAQGEYVAQISDDDMWMPTFLERCIETFGGSPRRAAAVYSDLYELYPDGSRIPFSRCKQPLLHGGFVPGMNINAMVFSRFYLDRVCGLKGRYFDDTFKIMGDSNLYGDLMQMRAPVLHRCEFLMVYRRHADQNWNARNLRITRFFEYARYRSNAGAPLPLGEMLWMLRQLTYQLLQPLPFPWWFVMGLPGILRQRSRVKP